jgi:hypothetical protein
LISVVSLVGMVLQQVAPAFMRNLRNKEYANEYARSVKDYIDTAVKPLRSRADVEDVVAKIRADPAINADLMAQLLESERSLVDRELADRADARRVFGDGAKSWQPAVVLIMSFTILGGIIIITTWFVLNPPKLSDNQQERDFVLQITGAVMGFLTGIGGMFARSFSSVFDYFYGSSVGSKQKTEQIGHLVAATVETNKSGDTGGMSSTDAVTDATQGTASTATPLDIMRQKMKPA